MIAQEEDNLTKMQRISKTFQEHMDDIMQLKMECRTLAQTVVTQNKEQEEVEGDLDFFLATFGLGKTGKSSFKTDVKHSEKGKKLSYGDRIGENSHKIDVMLGRAKDI